MMKRNLLFSLIFFISSITFAQNAAIEGYVQQSDSITSFSGASAYLDGINIGATSNGNGYFIIKEVPPGTHTLIVSAIGYLTLQKEVTVAAGKTLKADFTMEETIISIPEVSVMTKGNTRLKEIPGSAHYITPKELEKFSYKDINRTLRLVPGVNIQEEDGFGLRPSIGLRGTGVERSSKITVMEDGVLMAPAPYAAPAAYYFPTFGRMKGVEILKGSSQIKYGPYTTGGAINLISTQIPNEFGGRVSLLAGSFGSKNLHVYVGNSHKNFGYMVETYQYGSDGFKQLDGGGNTGFDKQDYLAKFRINTNDDAKIYQSLTFKIGQTLETSNETYLGLAEEDFKANPYRRYSASQKDQMNTEHSQFSLNHVAEFSKAFKITTTAYRTDFKRNWYKLDKVDGVNIGNLLDDPNANNAAYNIMTGLTSADYALDVKANNRSYYAQGIQTVLGYNFKTGRFNHDLNFGFRYHEDEVDRFQWVDKYQMDNVVMKLTTDGMHGTESNRVESAKAAATYLQYKLTVNNLTVTPGIRYENITLERMDYGRNDPDRTGAELSERSNTADVFIPGVGMDYRFSKYLSSFAGIHKGFSPPGSKEGTLPEKSINYELGVRYSKNALSGQAVIFFNDYSNLLGSDLAATGGAGTTDQFNGGDVNVSGLEFQLTFDLLSTQKQTAFSLPLSLVYTYTDATFQNDFESDYEPWGTVASGDQLPYLANNQLAFILGLEHHKFSVNLNGKYLDAMRTKAGQGDIPANEKTDAQFVLDTSASYNLHRHIIFFVNLTNLTDQVYNVARRPAGLRPGMPRAFNGGLKVSF